MAGTPQSLPDREGTLIRSSFVRGRNVLIAEGAFASLFAAHQRHRTAFGIEVEARHLELFSEFLAGFALHAASHPRNAVMAWTIHFQDPSLNIFLCGDTECSSVTGRVFTEGLADEDHNMFYQDLVVRGKAPHRSIVPFEGTHPKGTIEFYYSQSEQRPGRFFSFGGDRYALFTAHPDWDQAWFRNLDPAAAARVAESEEVVPIESRLFKLYCGCHYRKILDILSGPMASDPDGLFGEGETVQVNCPRCAARYTVSREAMEAHLLAGGS